MKKTIFVILCVVCMLPVLVCPALANEGYGVHPRQFLPSELIALLQQDNSVCMLNHDPTSGKVDYVSWISYDYLSELSTKWRTAGVVVYNSTMDAYFIRVSYIPTISSSGGREYCGLGTTNGFLLGSKRETSTPAPDITVVVPSVPSVSFDDTNVLNALEDIYDRLTLMTECQIEALHDIILNARFVSNLISLVDDDIYPRLLDILATNSNTYNLLANFLDSFNSKFSDLDSLFGTDSSIEIQSGDTFTWDSSSQGLVSAVADGSASNIRFTPTTVLSGYNTGWNDDGHFSITPADGSYFPSVLDVGTGMVSMPTVETSEVETITNPALNPDVPSAYAQYSECYVGTSINTGIVPYTGMYLETSGSFGFGGGASSSPQYLFGTKGLSIDIPAGGQSLRFVSGSSTWNHEKNFAGNGTYTTSFGIRWTFGSSVWVSCGTVRSSDSVTAFPAAPSTLYLSGVNDSDNSLNRKAVTWKRTTIKDSNGDLLYALIPCKRISDGVSGLYRVDYADGVCTGGTFLTGNYCTAYSELPLTVEAPVTQSVNFVRLYRAPSNIWYALATDGTSHAFTLESLVALVKAFPVCEYANVASVANIPDGSYQVTWSGDAQSITINYQAYSKFFTYISNQLAYNRSWLDERLTQLPTYDDTNLLSAVTTISDQITEQFGEYDSTYSFPAFSSSGQSSSSNKAVSGVLPSAFTSIDPGSQRLLYSPSSTLTLSKQVVYSGGGTCKYVYCYPYVHPTYGLGYRLEFEFHFSSTQKTARAETVQFPQVSFVNYSGKTLTLSAHTGTVRVFAYATNAYSYSYYFPRWDVSGSWLGWSGQNDTFLWTSSSYAPSKRVYLTPPESGTYYIYGTSDTAVPVVYASRFTGFLQSQTDRVVNAVGSIPAPNDYTAQLTAVAEKLDALANKPAADLTNIESALSTISDKLDNTASDVNNTIINITNDNDYFSVFYITDGDGNTQSVTDFAGDLTGASGKLLSLLYRLVFSDALDSVDGDLGSIEDFFTSEEPPVETTALDGDSVPANEVIDVWDT